ncbi:DUF7344 domain-containing protein [Halopelagius longus]|nr:ArsR family transcriptional regulator [Halopelagius longus]
MTDNHFEVLANGHRRRILASLLEENPHSVFPVTTGEVSAERQRKVQIAFRHVHLPKLDAAEFIDWDPESDRIAEGTRFEDIEPLLRYLTDEYDDCFETSY